MTAIRAIAFFPWWAISEPATLGPVRLLPYERGVAPGDRTHVAQRDVDAVIGAYANGPRREVRKATLIEVDDWQLGQDPSPVVARLFAAQEAIAFSALAERSLFGGPFGYCCFHDFSLTVQRYQEGKGDTFAFTLRRRDGLAQHIWSSEDFAFQKPLHVGNMLKLPRLDASLVGVLMSGSLPQNWMEAVFEFNRANTDSTDVPTHVELIMMKSAFEQLLKIRPEWQDFERALDGVLGAPPPGSTEGPLGERWRQRFPRSTRLVHAWAREFCDRRGAAAHGSKGGNRFIWTESSHLAFASRLLPLVFKKLAADAGLYQMDPDDVERLSRVDEYIAHDPMSFREGRDEYAKHPWLEIDLDIRMRGISRHLRTAVDEALDGEAEG